jgi:hypothetical protein
MAHLEKLLAIGSAPLAAKPESMPDLLKAYALGPELFEMLQRKNGFYSFESALHVLPITRDPGSSLEGWNADSLWRNEYQDLARGLLFFGEDILQDQFCLPLKHKGVFRFVAETGQIEFFADSVEKWAQRILADYRAETGWPLAQEWQQKNGPLPQGQRLMPKIPFVMGGEYNIENLWAGDAVQGMRFKGDMALQIRDVPDGGAVKLNIGSKPGP